LQKDYNTTNGTEHKKHTENEMIQAETKIAATHRLQDDGRWDEASIYRGEMRAKFCAEGLTKREANEKVRAAMSLNFPPPPNEDYVDYFEEEGERSRPYLDIETFNFLNVFCKVRAILYRLTPAEMEHVSKPTTEIRLEPPTTLPLGSSERVNDLLEFAFEYPLDFLGHCGEALEEAIDELPDDTGDSLEDFLPEFVDSIPAMQRIIQQRFTGALCP
jgi:hypothetical protein